MRLANVDSMTPREIELVQDGWRKVLPVASIAAELFYGKLFSLDPALQPLFKGDMREQGRNLTAMISIAVRALSRPDTIERAVHELGRRHVSYGVKPHHYDTFAVALLWALEQVLGEAFSAEAKDAWTTAYRVLAKTMKDAGGTVAA
jgi:hemoglobin-like flavoprotein